MKLRPIGFVLLLIPLSSCQSFYCGVDEDFLAQRENVPAISDRRYTESLRAAKSRNTDALIAFIRLAESNPVRSLELGYPAHLLQLARIWGDRSFADAISVFSERDREKIGASLLGEVRGDFERAYPQTLSMYHKSQSHYEIPKRLPRR